MDTPNKLTKKDFTSDQEVRWCPGCGDYAILAAMQRTLPELGATRHNTVFVSGIGCSSRFPYYMDTYGFHTIHGRAPALATGLKLANPKLDVWVITGDGDGLSIGGNHLMHILRRNVDVQIMLFNNRIYGLTKGQYSPTSIVGQRSPSTPMGSLDMPVNPAVLALGANARFVARGIDTVVKILGGLFKRAHEHKGTSFLEILQNCPVFNDGTWNHVTAREVAADNQLWVEHGQPLLFGKEKNKGLRWTADGSNVEVATIGEDGVTVEKIIVHDETNRTLAFLLAQLMPSEFPIALGVLYCNPGVSYERAVTEQNALAVKKQVGADLNALLRSGHTWTVE
ncbi:MAG: 2-oxoacid:ferredoxin oxidoreductase subunit beta [Nannocystaceae bacterium]|nr:2-oxoacid:ferredoxin oxidoreductase subunit beta [Nannocystaceae bacterium]